MSLKLILWYLVDIHYYKNILQIIFCLIHVQNTHSSAFRRRLVI